MKRLRHPRSVDLEKRRRIAGFLFVLPWIIGFWGFFLRPMLSALAYSVCNVTISENGVGLTFAGFKGFYDAFFTDLYYVRYLTGQLTEILWKTPVIIAFSLFMAVILNQRFAGRGIVRTVFFLPVIIGSGIALSIMSGDSMPSAIRFGTRSSMLFETAGIDTVLQNIGLGSELAGMLTEMVNSIFTLAWKSGLQILLFMSGLLSISGSLYESARVEGATRWSMFWKITFPMISPVLVLNVVYTLIDSFSDYSNAVMQYIYTFAKSLNLSYSAALSVIYFILIVAIIGITYAIVNRRVVYAVQ